MMPVVSWMWVAWGALFLVFVAFKLYVSRMSRNEDDQIILQDSFEHVRAEQAALMARLERTKPVGNAILFLLAAMTIFVLGYYVMDVVRQFR
jgi:hypothetical protein